MQKIKYFIIAIAFFGMAHAEESHNLAGVRAESMEERIADLKTSRELERESTESKQEDLLKTSNAVKANYSTSHSGAFYTFATISMDGLIELNDLSVWSVAPDDLYTILSWFNTDQLIITPNHSWFSSYSFKITNQATGEAILVNMKNGPLYNGQNTYWIVSIDHVDNIIYLSDGSKWDMSCFDRGITKKWLINDTVVIGINDGSLASYNPNILINVNMLNYARGQASW